MRAMKLAMGLALILSGAVHLSARDDDAVDLRGPAPKKGDTIATKSTFKIKDAEVKLSVAGMKLDAKQTLTAYEDEEIKVLAVDGRQATKVQTKVVKEKVEASTSLGGQSMDDTKDGDLHGEVIISERSKDGKWKHSLVDNKPNDKQKKDLDKRIGPENDDDLYPAEKVKVGHSWTVDASALQRIFGGSIQELKGKMKLKLVAIEEVDGEKCAVIELAGVITGIAKEDEGDLNVEMDMKGKTWRSIKTGLDVKDEASGTMKMSGKIEMDGVKVDLALEGPFTIKSTAKFK